MRSRGDQPGRDRIGRAVTATALLSMIVAAPIPSHADWRFTPAEFQGGAVFLDENPGMTSMDFIRFELGTQRILVGAEAFGLRFQMEKKNGNQIVSDRVWIWETLPVTATYVLYDWEEAEGLTRGYRYVYLYGRVNFLLARTFDDQQVRYGEGGVALSWNGPHRTPLVSLAVRASYRVQHLGESGEGENRHESELEHQLLLGVSVSLDFWSASYFKLSWWRKQNEKRERDWMHYDP